MIWQCNQKHSVNRLSVKNLRCNKILSSVHIHGSKKIWPSGWCLDCYESKSERVVWLEVLWSCNMLMLFECNNECEWAWWGGASNTEPLIKKSQLKDFRLYFGKKKGLATEANTFLFASHCIKLTAEKVGLVFSSTLYISFKNGNKMSRSAGVIKMVNFASKMYRFMKRRCH